MKMSSQLSPQKRQAFTCLLHQSVFPGCDFISCRHFVKHMVGNQSLGLLPLGLSYHLSDTAVVCVQIYYVCDAHGPSLNPVADFLVSFVIHYELLLSAKLLYLFEYCLELFFRIVLASGGFINAPFDDLTVFSVLFDFGLELFYCVAAQRQAYCRSFLFSVLFFSFLFFSVLLLFSQFNRPFSYLFHGL